MPKMSAEEIAAKWARNTAAASQDYAAGIDRVTVSPGAAAAAKYQKWQAGLQASGDKWRSRVGAVTLSDWQLASKEKGQARFASGAQAAEGKNAQFWREFGPHLDSVTSRVRAMPDTSPEDRIQRMVAQVRGTAQFRRGR